MTIVLLTPMLLLVGLIAGAAVGDYLALRDWKRNRRKRAEAYWRMLQ